jgi:hypothetical protein
MTIIGLGNAGCNVAEKFEKIDGVKVISIDVDIEGEHCISIKQCNSPEEYENTFPDISEELEYCDDKIFLVVGGSGRISGASLSLLKQLRHKQINVIYIKPDTSVLDKEEMMQEKLVFNVFQEYARSGMFNRCILIDNLCVEKLLGDVPIIGFYDKLNDVIFNALGFVLTHETKTGIVNNLQHLKDSERICTVGFFDLTSDQESLLYELENVSSKHFYFVFGEEQLKTDGGLSKKLKNLVQNKTDENTKSSYIVYASKQPEEYSFMIAFSKHIQP